MGKIKINIEDKSIRVKMKKVKNADGMLASVALIEAIIEDSPQAIIAILGATAAMAISKVGDQLSPTDLKAIQKIEADMRRNVRSMSSDIAAKMRQTLEETDDPRIKSQIQQGLDLIAKLDNLGKTNAPEPIDDLSAFVAGLKKDPIKDSEPDE